MKPIMKPKQRDEAGEKHGERKRNDEKQQTQNPYLFLRYETAAVVTGVSHRPAAAMATPRSMSRVVRDIRSPSQTETPTRLLRWFRGC